LSRWSIESVEELPRVDWFPAARAVLETPIGPLQVLNVHLRPPRTIGGSYLVGHVSTPTVREDEIRSYATALDAKLCTLVVGDFNEGDHGRAVRWLEALGFRNALPQFEPRANTWRWPIGFITLKASYDHILYDQALELQSAEVRNRGRSDHLPVIGVFTARTGCHEAVPNDDRQTDSACFKVRCPPSRASAARSRGPAPQCAARSPRATGPPDTTLPPQPHTSMGREQDPVTQRVTSRRGR